MVDVLVEAWVRKCWSCNGVVMGPPLDDGVRAIEEENCSWTCQRCGRTEDYHDEDHNYRELRLWNVTTERKMLQKARSSSFDEFTNWVNEQVDKSDDDASSFH